MKPSREATARLAVRREMQRRLEEPIARAYWLGTPLPLGWPPRAMLKSYSDAQLAKLVEVFAEPYEKAQRNREVAIDLRASTKNGGQEPPTQSVPWIACDAFGGVWRER
jgi:hypothetical protein